MLVEVTVCEKKRIKNSRTDECDCQLLIICEEIQQWNTFETTQSMFCAAKSMYGRCSSKIYIETAEKIEQHIGWVFEKQQKYSDCDETYIQETWIVPLKRQEVKIVKEYALED